MEKFVLGTLVVGVLFIAPLANAKPIYLPAGGSVVIDGDVISCQSQVVGEDLPTCTVQKGQSYYFVYVGKSEMGAFLDLSGALDRIQMLREAHLCR